MATHNASYNQAIYRGRNDDGSETAANWIAAENTDWTQAADTLFRVRFKIEQTVTNANALLSKQFKVKFSHNGGTFTDAGGQGTTTQPIRYANSTHLTDDEATTEQMTNLQPFIPGKVIEVPPSGTITFTDSARSDTEIEAVLEIVGSNVSPDDTLVLRLYESNDTALATYTVAPTVTVAAGASPQSEPVVAATESETGQAVTPTGVVTVTVGETSETEAAQAVSTQTLVSISVGEASETDLAQVVAPSQPAGGQTISVTPTTESETAGVIAMARSLVQSRPDADNFRADWDTAPTPGQDLFAQIDEETADDNDYIFVEVS